MYAFYGLLWPWALNQWPSKANPFITDCTLCWNDLSCRKTKVWEHIAVDSNYALNVVYLCSENYLFHCSCDKCQLEADQPDMTSEEEDDDDGDDDDMEFVE